MYIPKKYHAVTVIHWREFQELVKYNGIVEAIKKIQEWDIEARKLSGEEHEIQSIRFTNSYGMEFKVAFYSGKYGWSMNIWTIDDFAIYSTARVPEAKNLFSPWFQEVLKIMDDFSRGKIRCSCCEKLVDFQAVRDNRYFAGVYCQDCWEFKYKAIEARESYN